MTVATIGLRCGEASAEIALHGAEARAWRVGEHELLWPGDAAIWSEISPILFPVVGWTRDGARVDGRHYSLGLHGFARTQEFALEAQRQDFARLTLSDNAQTRAVYPFGFVLAVEYSLTENALTIALEVANSGTTPLPYACGLHPGFRWPFAGQAREGCAVHFEKPETALIPVIAKGGLISRAMRPVPFDGSRLPLDDDLFRADALCFFNPASRSLRFEGPAGAAIAMDLGGFDHAALWTRPGAPFLCLEAWTGFSDPDGFAGDLFAKPGMRVLAPGESQRHEARYRFSARVES